MESTYIAEEEAWIRKADPRKRFLTGQAYLNVKRATDLAYDLGRVASPSISNVGVGACI